jgi:hypothetical protein
MSNRFFDQLQHLQQPGAAAPALSTLVSYSQQQQWPNQGPDDDSVELDDDDDLAAAADSIEALDDDDDDLTAGVDSADDDTDDLRAKALSAERQKNNRLERELRTMKQPALPAVQDQPRGVRTSQGCRPPEERGPGAGDCQSRAAAAGSVPTARCAPSPRNAMRPLRQVEEHAQGPAARAPVH